MNLDEAVEIILEHELEGNKTLKEFVSATKIVARKIREIYPKLVEKSHFPIFIEGKWHLLQHELGRVIKQKKLLRTKKNIEMSEKIKNLLDRDLKLKKLIHTKGTMELYEMRNLRISGFFKTWKDYEKVLELLEQYVDLQQAYRSAQNPKVIQKLKKSLDVFKRKILNFEIGPRVIPSQDLEFIDTRPIEPHKAKPHQKRIIKNWVKNQHLY